MRSVIALVLIFAAAAFANPTGNYCGSVPEYGITTKMTFAEATFNLEIDGNGSKTVCDNEAYNMDGNTVAMPNLNNADDCVGNLQRDGGVTLKISYDAGANSVALDAGIGIMQLNSC